MIMVAMITVPASEIDMNDNVPLTITITDALSPYSNHSVLLWDILLVFAFSPVVIWLTSSFVSSPAWAPTRWHAHLSRAASGAFDAPTSLIPAFAPPLPFALHGPDAFSDVVLGHPLYRRGRRGAR